MIERAEGDRGRFDTGWPATHWRSDGGPRLRSRTRPGPRPADRPSGVRRRLARARHPVRARSTTISPNRSAPAGRGPDQLLVANPDYLATPAGFSPGPAPGPEEPVVPRCPPPGGQPGRRRRIQRRGVGDCGGGVQGRDHVLHHVGVAVEGRPGRPGRRWSGAIGGTGAAGSSTRVPIHARKPITSVPAMATAVRGSRRIDRRPAGREGVRPTVGT